MALELHVCDGREHWVQKKIKQLELPMLFALMLADIRETSGASQAVCDLSTRSSMSIDRSWWSPLTQVVLAGEMVVHIARDFGAIATPAGEAIAESFSVADMHKSVIADSDSVFL